MSIYNNIKTRFRSLTNVNAWANLADVNYAVAQAVPYTIVGAHLNQPLGQPSSITILTACCTNTNPCDCTPTGNACSCFTISNFATGKYMITMSVPAANGFDVLIAPLADARQNISVEVVSPTQFIVTTYDIVGAAYINNAFKNTYLEVRLWHPREIQV